MGVLIVKIFWKWALIFWKRSKVVRSLDKLKEALAKLEITKNLFEEKASQEAVNAKKFTRAKDETAAFQCWRRKKLYEKQIEQLANLELRISDQMITLQGGEAAARAVDALKIGAAAMKAMYIRDVDNVICDIDEQIESMKQMLEAVSAPSGAAALINEDDLKAELAELEGAE